MLKLGYDFHDPTLLARALSHRSAGKDNNERLEFFGDSILGFIISEALFDQFPEASEGELSQCRASLVKGATLAKIASELGIKEHLNLGLGERKTGGANRKSILADALEAVICAIYLEAGMARCRECVLAWFASRLASLNLSQSQQDAKTRLQEWLQARKRPLPVYEVLARGGDHHLMTFTVQCSLKDAAVTTTASATSKRGAEKEAAAMMINELEREQ